MTINFPDPPLTVGRVYNDGVLSWMWDGEKWASSSLALAGEPTLPWEIGQGGTGEVTAPEALVALGAAPLDSPDLVGLPTAPTPPYDNNSTRLATTEYVDNYADDPTPHMFGAIADGIFDCTEAIQACIDYAYSVKKNIYIPPGTYKITDALVFPPYILVNGGGRQRTNLTVKEEDFNMDALGVFVLEYPGGQVIKDLGIYCFQPDSLVRADYIQYPVAIYMVDAARVVLDRIRITGAWDGINAFGATGGCHFPFLEIGALHMGIKFNGAKAYVHGGHWHFWLWGFSTDNQLAVYTDGNTYSCQFGEIDGMDINSIMTWYGNIQFMAGTTIETIAPDMIGRLMMDGRTSQLRVEGRKVTIGYMHIKAHEPNSCILVANDAQLSVRELSLHAGQSTNTADCIVVNGSTARLAVNSGKVYHESPGYSAFRLYDGEMVLNNIKFTTISGIARTVATVAQSGATSILKMRGNYFDAKAGGATGDAVSIGTENARHHIVGNDFADWTIAMPAAPLLGEYGPNQIWFTVATPSIVFSTPGDFVPTYTLQVTNYTFPGQGLIQFTSVIQFNTNAYTTASGSARMNIGIPFFAATTASLVIGQVSRVVYGAGNTISAELSTDGMVSFRLYASGAVTTSLTTAGIPPSTTGILIRIGGTYRYR